MFNQEAVFHNGSWYVSYNPNCFDSGKQETALCVLQPKWACYILMGDHREEFKKRQHDFDMCFKYWEDHQGEWGPTTDMIRVSPLGAEEEKEKMETTMKYLDEVSMSAAVQTVNGSNIVMPEPTDQIQKKFLKSQAYAEYDRQISKLRKQFALEDDERPKTLAELIKRFQDGKFYVNPLELDIPAGRYAMDYIRWRDPENMPDGAGYKAAKDLLDAKLKNASYAVMLKDNDAGMAAVKEIENFTA